MQMRRTVTPICDAADGVSQQRNKCNLNFSSYLAAYLGRRLYLLGYFSYFSDGLHNCLSPHAVLLAQLAHVRFHRAVRRDACRLLTLFGNILDL